MKVVKHILVAYLSLVALFTVALVGAFSIPSRVIEDNVRQSVRQVIDDGEVFSARVGEVNPLAVDVFSDCLLLGIAYCTDSDHPLQAAMDAAFMMQDGSTIEGAQLMMDGTVADKPPLTVYSRYWQSGGVAPAAVCGDGAHHPLDQRGAAGGPAVGPGSGAVATRGQGRGTGHLPEPAGRDGAHGALVHEPGAHVLYRPCVVIAHRGAPVGD